jgi:hypothetical protein
MSIVQALTQTAPQRLAPESAEAASSPERERRESTRHGCRIDASCQPIAAPGNRWPAQAVDISTSGVSLVLSRRFEPGTILAVSLAGVSDCTPLARVQCVAPHGLYWRIGCVWADPLTPEELRNLVGVAIPPE